MLKTFERKNMKNSMHGIKKISLDGTFSTSMFSE